jgi:hypothetical protein
MAAVKKRLDELVADAAQRYLRGEAVSDWVAGHGPRWEDYADEYAEIAWEFAGEAVAAAEQGDFRSARKLAELTTPYWHPRAEFVLEDDADLGDCPAWAAFREACELAERIDSFLAAVGRGAQGAGLAVDCRECLDTLLVLADWCDDRGQPAAAAEARHLHALALSLH